MQQPAGSVLGNNNNPHTAMNIHMPGAAALGMVLDIVLEENERLSGKVRWRIRTLQERRLSTEAAHENAVVSR